MARKLEHYMLQPDVLNTGDQLEPIVVELAEKTAFKPASSTEGHVAVFDANGDLADGGAAPTGAAVLNVNMTIESETVTLTVQSTAAEQSAWWASDSKKLDIVDADSGVHYILTPLSTLVQTAEGTAAGWMAYFYTGANTISEDFKYIRVYNVPGITEGTVAETLESL